jgi:hypothetical protein
MRSTVPQAVLRALQALAAARRRGQGDKNVVEIGAFSALCPRQQLWCGVEELRVTEIGAVGE